MAELSELQSKLLEMLKFFHKYCVKNNITYIALGGTMLGAVRHHGFIPWDDDVDVGVPRPEYEKLIELLQNENGRYIIETTQSEDRKFLYPYAKLYDTKTTLIEKTRVGLKRGIYIDIFPLDGLSNNYEEGRQAYKIIEKLRGRLALRTLNVRKGRKWYKNLAIIAARMIPFKSFDEKHICLALDDICKRRSFYDYQYGGNLNGAWGFKEVMDRSIVGSPQLYKFESIEIYGAEKYDEYLTHLYGDWRKLPPIEKRVTHHGYYLDLNNGYLENDN